MEKLHIIGGKKLSGKLQAQGSKNGLEPVMIASLLTDDPVIIHHIPDLADTKVLIEILESLGKKVVFSNDTAIITQARPLQSEAPARLIQKMRASIIILGPLLARTGRAKLVLPGGCSFGDRPVDLHLFGMEKLGAKIIKDNNTITATADNLTGCDMVLKSKFGPTVLGTDNVMMAAALTQGTTKIIGAAREPECTALAQMLVAMGAKITGIGTDTITITGVDRLSGCEVYVIPDRIEAVSYLIAGLATGDAISVSGVEKEHIAGALDILRNIGAQVEISDNTITVKKPTQLQPFHITTAPYPGLATDLQALFAVLALTIPGQSKITDTIYPERFAYAHELRKMGADITFEEGGIIINGGKPLKGTEVVATDLRAGAALAIAGCLADGETHLSGIHHLLRGYEHFDDKINSLGGSIKYV